MGTSNQKKVNGEFNLIQAILCLLSPLVLVILVIVALVCLIYRQIVNLILWIKYGDTYGGLLAPQDAVWTIESVSKNTVNIVLLVRYDEECQKTKSFSEWCTNQAHEAVNNDPITFLKMTGTRHTLLGCNYLLKNTYTLDECLKPMDENVTDEDSLKQFASEVSNKPLPKNGAAFWEMYIGSKPILWRNNPAYKNLYPLITRVSHTVGDGWSLISVLVLVFSDPKFKNSIYLKDLVKNLRLNDRISTKQDLLTMCFAFLQNLIKILKLIMKSLDIMVRQTLTRTRDNTVWNNKEMTGDKIAVWQTEEIGEIVPICKEIRRKIPNGRFSQIVFSAIGCSVARYFEQKNCPLPENIGAFITVLLSIPSKPTFTNNFTMAMIDLPSKSSKSMLDLLRQIQNPESTRKKTEEAELNYWLMNGIVGLLPVPLLRLALNQFQQTIAISNFPMPFKITLAEGAQIEEIIIFPPNWGESGVTFSTTSYGNKFQSALLVDKALISDRNEAQSIVNGIFKNFEQLKYEVERNKSL